MVVSSGVGRIAVSIEATDIADADTESVLPFAMATCILNILAQFDFPVEVDDIVVTAVSTAIHIEASLLVPLLYVLQSEVKPHFCRRTMDDDFRYFSHFRNLLLFFCLLLLKL